MNEEILKKKIFDLDFDFFDIDTSNLKAQIVNVKMGKNRDYERQFGLAFVNASDEIKRQIDIFVQEHGEGQD
jgi:hypothetical protein